MKLTIKLFLAFTLTLNSTAFATDETKEAHPVASYQSEREQIKERYKEAGIDTICNGNYIPGRIEELKNCSDEELNRSYADLELVEQEIASVSQQIQEKRSEMSRYGVSIASLDTLTLRMSEIGGVLIITSVASFGMSALVAAGETKRLTMIPVDSTEYKKLMRSKLTTFFMKTGFLSLVGAYAIGFSARKIRTVEVDVKLADVYELQSYLFNVQRQLTIRKAIIEASLSSRGQ